MFTGANMHTHPTHPDDWEALEDQHIEFSTLLDPETNAETCHELGLDIPSLTAWYNEIHHNKHMIDDNINNIDTTQQSLDVASQFFNRIREQSTKYGGQVAYPYMVGYYEGLIRRLITMPEVQQIVSQL